MAATFSIQAASGRLVWFRQARGNSPPGWRRYESIEADREQEAKHVCRAQHTGIAEAK